MKTPLMKNWYKSWLVPFAEGSLDARRRAKLEARLAGDPALAAEAEAVRRTVRRLREASQEENGGATPAAPAPSAWPQIEARLRPARRTAARPWLWAGGLCAATSLAWATLWGPLTPHTAYPVKSVPTVQTAAEETGPKKILSPGAGGGRPRKLARGSGRTIKRSPRMNRPAGTPRPAPTELLANRDTAAPPDGPREAPRAAQSGSGRLQLTTQLRDLPQRKPDQAPQEGLADQVPVPDDGNAAPAGEAPDTTQAKQPPARASRRKTHHRRHRRRHGAEQTTPAQATPALPPDTVPQAEPVPPALKHRPDID